MDEGTRISERVNIQRGGSRDEAVEEESRRMQAVRGARKRDGRAMMEHTKRGALTMPSGWDLGIQRAKSYGRLHRPKARQLWKHI